MRAVGSTLRLLVTSQAVIRDPVKLHDGRFRRRWFDDGGGGEKRT